MSETQALGLNKARDKRLKGQRKTLLDWARGVQLDFEVNSGKDYGTQLLQLMRDRIEELEIALRKTLESCESNDCTKGPDTTCWWCKGAWEVLEGE